MNYKRELAKARYHAEQVRRKQEIKAIKHKNDKPKKKMEFSKKAFILVFLDCLLIQLFSMWIMVYLADASNLSSLIGIAVALIGEVGAVFSYNRKSSAENTAGGIIYESYMNSIKSENELTAEEIRDAVG